jgi:hypothetical protein
VFGQVSSNIKMRESVRTSQVKVAHIRTSSHRRRSYLDWKSQYYRIPDVVYSRHYLFRVTTVKEVENMYQNNTLLLAGLR